MPQHLVRLFAISTVLGASPAVTFAQQNSTPAAASSGNLPFDFYAKADCHKSDQFTLPKPSFGDREGISSYNLAVQRHNSQLRAFDACINDYVGKASKDIDWIMLLVNSEVAKTNGTNSPAKPTAPGNMAAGFYSSPGCVAPDRQQLGPVPDGHDVKAMEVHNHNVETNNILADEFNACIKGYVGRAHVDIQRIENAQRNAASQVSE
jgi:hypothetical protein